MGEMFAKFGEKADRGAFARHKSERETQGFGKTAYIEDAWMLSVEVAKRAAAAESKRV
jgi:hypothetical protein